MKWARRYRARLRRAIRAALGTWRQEATLAQRGIVRFTWQQDVTEELLTDAVPLIEDWLADDARVKVKQAVHAKRRELGAA